MSSFSGLPVSLHWKLFESYQTSFGCWSELFLKIQKTLGYFSLSYLQLRGLAKALYTHANKMEGIYIFSSFYYHSFFIGPIALHGVFSATSCLSSYIYNFFTCHLWKSSNLFPIFKMHKQHKKNTPKQTLKIIMV